VIFFMCKGMENPTSILAATNQQDKTHPTRQQISGKIEINMGR
jgi:hypothetical protein